MPEPLRITTRVLEAAGGAVEVREAFHAAVASLAGTFDAGRLCEAVGEELAAAMLAAHTSGRGVVFDGDESIYARVSNAHRIPAGRVRG